MKSIDYRFKFLSMIGILCVVCEHTGSLMLAPDRLFIYGSFHMPLFFFISGYFFHRELSNPTEIRRYIGKRVVRLLFPLWGWTLFYLLFCVLMRRQDFVPFQRGLSTFNVWDVFIGPFEWIAHSRMNIAAWFVGVLFLVEVNNAILWWILPRRLKESPVFYLLFLAIGCFGVWIAKGGHFAWMGGNRNRLFARVLYCLFWYETGVWYKGCFERYEKRIPNAILFSVVLIAEVVLSLVHRDTGIGSVVYTMRFPIGIFETILVAAIAILFWLRIASIWGEAIVRNSKAAMCIANHTFDIMMHQGFAVWLVSTIIYTIHTNVISISTFDANMYSANDWYVCVPQNGGVVRHVYIIVSILVPIMISWVIRALKCNLKRMMKERGE